MAAIWWLSYCEKRKFVCGERATWQGLALPEETLAQSSEAPAAIGHTAQSSGPQPA